MSTQNTADVIRMDEKVATGDPAKIAKLVTKALTERRVIEIRYVNSAGVPSKRKFRPYVLTRSRQGDVSASGRDFLTGEDGRTFRLDRILEVLAIGMDTINPKPERGGTILYPGSWSLRSQAPWETLPDTDVEKLLASGWVLEPSDKIHDAPPAQGSGYRGADEDINIEDVPF